METKKICSTANATIMACQKIVQSFSENIFELSHIRTDWNHEYIKDLKDRIKSAKKDYLPSETYCLHTEKQNYVHDLMISSLKDITLFRALVKVEFKDDPKFQKLFFEELGYNDLFSDAKNGDYHSLYYLAERFHLNMTPAIREKLISKTIPIAMIDKAMSYHQEMLEFKSCFDLINESTYLSIEGKRKINEIFSEIKDICRVASAYYMFDPIKRDMFCFFRVMLSLKRSIPETIYSK